MHFGEEGDDDSETTFRKKDNDVAAVAMAAVAGALLAVEAIPDVLDTIGYTPMGITAGSIAASMMSREAAASRSGGVAAGGRVASLQSTGAAGPSLRTVIGAAVVGAAVGAGAVLLAKTLRERDVCLVGCSDAHRGRRDDRSASRGQIGDISALRPGNVIALHSPVFNRFIRVMGEEVDGGGGKKNLDELPTNWGCERLTVVDAGNRQIALYGGCHRRFIRLNGKNVDARGGVIDINNRLPHSPERFTVVDAGDGKIALYSKSHHRLVRMSFGGKVDANGALGINDLPYAGAWEAFSVLLLDE